MRKVFEDFDPKRLPDLWLTTNHVVMETIRLTKRQIGHEPAVQMGRRLYSERLVEVLARADDDTWQRSEGRRGARVRVATIGCELSVDEIYGTALGAPPS